MEEEVVEKGLPHTLNAKYRARFLRLFNRL